MLSIPDMAVIGALALIFFGPEQLPRVARQFGRVVRDVQNTSQSFIREMERAADETDATAAERARQARAAETETPRESETPSESEAPSEPEAPREPEVSREP
jgi:sec-independent protein translocase protein TatA